MKRILLPAFTLFCLLSSCLDSADDADQDLQSPLITPISSSQAIIPGHFTEIPGDVSSIPMAFQVEDDMGISEIVIDSHGGFDGHTHGRIANNGNFVLFSYNHIIRHEDMENPRLFQSEPDDDLTIYLDDRNPSIPSDGLVLAGPYHFAIKASDLEGNETSYADNTTYHSTFYIQRDYAPQMEVNALDTNTGTVSGNIWRNMDHPFSSDIVFIWIYIARPDPANPAQEGEIRAEWIWGKSNWPHQFRSDSGPNLISGQAIDLSELLQDQEAIQSMTESEILTIWAEDANGNISVRSF